MTAGVENVNHRTVLMGWFAHAAVNKQDYLARLQVAVSQLHNCGA